MSLDLEKLKALTVVIDRVIWFADQPESYRDRDSIYAAIAAMNDLRTCRIVLPAAIEEIERLRGKRDDAIASLNAWEEEHKDSSCCSCRFESDGERVAECEFHKRLRADLAEAIEALRPFAGVVECEPPIPDDAPYLILGSTCMALNGPEYEMHGGTWPHPLYGHADVTMRDRRRARAVVAKADEGRENETERKRCSIDRKKPLGVRKHRH